MKKLRIIIAAVMVLFLLAGATPAKNSSAVKVHIINVGQGDAILVQTGRENILIDGGNKGKGKTVIAYLKKHKVRTLNAVVSTHPDADHVGGLAAVIDEMNVKSVYAPRVTHTTIAYSNFLKAVKRNKLKIKVAKKGVTIPTAPHNVNMTFIAPVKDYHKNDLNNWSAVLKLQHGKKQFLFTGDIETKAENDLVKAKSLNKVDVLKVSHHGAKEATTANFLAKTKPAYAAISVGGKNRYGHPTGPTLKRLSKIGAKVYRTDKGGTIVFSSNGKKIKVTRK
ncbi:competence protein [Brochothrix thermosphacta]|uniref:ComEC/Rec2 family competence protein n=1 Tax=Brochothrix thermosphacta TaxID=2756 RepID=UPI000E76B53F|nr:ComEC/Rec2 family competence protein [Brochothrix thermosphacta]ANZ94197.1 competence protein [Brochothrix thermosphacta]